MTRADAGAGFGLPGWVYHDAEFFAAETARVFRPSWQVVCHVSNIPEPGDYHTLAFAGENIAVVRGEDGAVRALSHVCRHRGARILDGACGRARKLTCPYHAWSYELDGRLSGVPLGETYEGLDFKTLGLPVLESEVWRGFVFVRLQGGGPTVAEMMAPHEDEIAPYRFEEMRAVGRVTLRPRDVNWKNIADNYSDGLHIPVSHPGLTRLFGKSYGIEAQDHVDRMWGDLEDRPSANWSERLYQKLLPPVPHLPEASQRHWLYFKLWPTVAFDIYPDQVDFMQWLPTGPTTCLIREISYVLPDAPDDPWRREMRAARYLNWRINRQVNLEDTALITRVQEGMASRSFSMGPLSDKEVCLKSFCRKMREIIPEARQEERPAAGWSKR